MRRVVAKVGGAWWGEESAGEDDSGSQLPGHFRSVSELDSTASFISFLVASLLITHHVAACIDCAGSHPPVYSAQVRLASGVQGVVWWFSSSYHQSCR